MLRNNNNNKNISKTAKILGVLRHTVRRAIYGSLVDKPRKPKTCLRKLSSKLENLIIEKTKRIRFLRNRCLALCLLRKCAIKISENTIKSVLKKMLNQEK